MFEATQPDWLEVVASGTLYDVASDTSTPVQKIGRKGEVRYGYAAAVVVDAARGEVQGGAEPRRSHGAVGVGPAAGQ